MSLFSSKAKADDLYMCTPVPKKLQPSPHSYAGYGGPWIENYFHSYWQRAEKRLANKNEINRIYIPIFWTDYYAKHGFHRKHYNIQSYLDKNICPNKEYFTLVQNDDGILEELPSNVFVFSAGGLGDCPIPLLKGNCPVVNKKKDITCSFMGMINGPSDRTGVRSKTYQALNLEPNFHFSYGTFSEFIEITSRSVFTLCPRGYGRTSFRLYEAMALGSIPVYIWDDVEWLPYRDVLDWNEFSISININDIKNLSSILHSHSPPEIIKKQDIIKQIYNDYFTFEGVCNEIVRMLSNPSRKKPELIKIDK